MKSGFIQGWYRQLQRAEVREQGLEGIYRGVTIMMNFGILFGQEEKWTGSKWLGSEKWLPYWILGLTVCHSSRVLFHRTGSRISGVRSEGKGWSGTSLMSLAPGDGGSSLGGLFPWLPHPTPVSIGSISGLHLSIAKWKFLLKDTENFSYFGVVMTFSFTAFYYGMFKYTHE